MTNAPKRPVFHPIHYVESDLGVCYEDGAARFCVRRTDANRPTRWRYTASGLPHNFSPLDAWEADT